MPQGCGRTHSGGGRAAASGDGKTHSGVGRTHSEKPALLVQPGVASGRPTHFAPKAARLAKRKAYLATRPAVGAGGGLGGTCEGERPQTSELL